MTSLFQTKIYNHSPLSMTQTESKDSFLCMLKDDYAPSDEIFDDNDEDINVDCTNMNDLFEDKEMDDAVKNKCGTENDTPTRKMERKNNNIQNLCFFMYYILSAHHYWIHPQFYSSYLSSLLLYFKSFA